MSHDEFTKLYLYMGKRFDKIEAELAKKATLTAFMAHSMPSKNVWIA